MSGYFRLRFLSGRVLGIQLPLSKSKARVGTGHVPAGCLTCVCFAGSDESAAVAVYMRAKRPVEVAAWRAWRCR
jgi:hypothetical protein